MQSSDGRSFHIAWLAFAILLAMLMLLLPESAAGEAQYRQSDLEFLRSLSARVDAAEKQLDELAHDESRDKAQSAPAVSTVRLKAQTPDEPDKAEGMYTRVSERLRHKNRAMNVDPENTGRVKVRFPNLQEHIDKARLRISEQQKASASRDNRKWPTQTELDETRFLIEDIEAKLELRAASAIRGHEKGS